MEDWLASRLRSAGDEDEATLPAPTEVDDETLVSSDPTQSFPDDPVHTSARLERLREAGEPGGEARDSREAPAPAVRPTPRASGSPDRFAGPSDPRADRPSQPGVGRVVARVPDPREADEAPTPVARAHAPPPPHEGAATVLHQRPSAPAAELPPVEEPFPLPGSQPEDIELSDPQIYTLDLELPPRPFDQEDPAAREDPASEVLDELDADRPHTAPSTPPLDEIGGYDEVFPLRSDPRPAIPAPPSSAPDETNALLESTGKRGRQGPSGPAGPEADEPGTQWVPRKRSPEATSAARGPQPVRPLPPTRRPLGDENTDVRGFAPMPSFDEDEDDAPTVIMPPPSGLGETPPGEQRADEVEEQRNPVGSQLGHSEDTVPGNQATVRLTRPGGAGAPPPGASQSLSSAALAASTLGVTLVVVVVGVTTLAVLRWMGVW